MNVFRNTQRIIFFPEEPRRERGFKDIISRIVHRMHAAKTLREYNACAIRITLEAFENIRITMNYAL
jgi:hypothetical protein